LASSSTEWADSQEGHPSVCHSDTNSVLPVQAHLAQLMTSMSVLQRGVNLIGERVEQSQIDIRECLKYHHPKLNDDDDWVFIFIFFVLVLFSEQFYFLLMV
jgi:hypothetical protein